MATEIIGRRCELILLSGRSLAADPDPNSHICTSGRAVNDLAEGGPFAGIPLQLLPEARDTSVQMTLGRKFVIVNVVERRDPCVLAHTVIVCFHCGVIVIRVDEAE